MQRILLLFLASIAYAQFDQYGGSKLATCRAGAFFSVTKIGSHLWLCTPAGHPLFFQGVNNTAPQAYDCNADASECPDGEDNNSKVIALYGDDNVTWAEVEAARLRKWGFNGNGTYLSNYIQPISTSNTYPGDHSIPTKLPSMLIERPMYYGAYNAQGYLDQGIKDLFFGVSPYYGGYYPTGEGDYFDSRFDTQLSGLLNNSPSYNPEYQAPRSPYKSYILGVAVEDSDETYGLDAGWDFATVPAGRGTPHLGWLFALSSPIQTANESPMQSNNGQIYWDTTVYAKQHWQSMLISKYKTIGSLNAVWGTGGYYTTFGSSGTTVTGEAFGIGDGSTTTFAHTLALANSVSSYSVQVFAAGARGSDLAVDASNNLQVSSASYAFVLTDVNTFINIAAGPGWQPGYYQITSVSSGAAILNRSPAPVATTVGTWTQISAAGDQGYGTIWGPNITGTIDYSSGNMYLTFANPPSSGAPITVNYVQNGWGYGTGLMDEDGRNGAWWGSGAGAYNTLTGVSSNLQTDLNNFLYDIANWFFSHSKSGVNNWTGGPGGSSMKGVLYVGPDGLFSSQAPSRAQVLKAAGNSIQVIISMFAQGIMSQAETDFIRTNFGRDAPMISTAFKTANVDSVFDFPISSISCSGGLVTVTTRVNNAFVTGGNVEISGVTVSGYNSAPNSSYTVTSINSPTQFTYYTTGTCPGIAGTSGNAFLPDPSAGGYPSQAARGASLVTNIKQLLSTSYCASGTKPYVGYTWWDWLDDPSEQLNWGLVTPLDNAYDGVQDRTATSIDIFGYRRGGEPTNMGNVISSVITANSLWVSQLVSLPLK